MCQVGRKSWHPQYLTTTKGTSQGPRASGLWQLQASALTPQDESCTPKWAGACILQDPLQSFRTWQLATDAWLNPQRPSTSQELCSWRPLWGSCGVTTVGCFPEEVLFGLVREPFRVPLLWNITATFQIWSQHSGKVPPQRGDTDHFCRPSRWAHLCLPWEGLQRSRRLGDHFVLRAAPPCSFPGRHRHRIGSQGPVGTTVHGWRGRLINQPRPRWLLLSGCCGTM